VFYYSRDRAGKHPQAHLANYTGIFCGATIRMRIPRQSG
jgi:hypothetical protein